MSSSSGYSMDRPDSDDDRWGSQLSSMSYSSFYSSSSTAQTNQFSTSTGLFPMYTNYAPISMTSATQYSYAPYETPSFPTSSDFACEPELGAQSRPTLTTLGWKEIAEHLRFYTFKVERGKEPYFDLNLDYPQTPQHPPKVYLDQPKDRCKGNYQCMHPLCKGAKFARPADLERHYRNVHTTDENKDVFSCDYPKCPRNAQSGGGSPFRRKDHFRDHLRDYHKEDIGCKKSWKDPKKQEWLKERKVNPNWWRCGKCLIRVMVKQQGWTCGGCGAEAENAKELRREIAKGEEKEEGYSFSGMCDICGGGNFYVGGGKAMFMDGKNVECCDDCAGRIVGSESSDGLLRDDAMDYTSYGQFYQ